MGMCQPQVKFRLTYVNQVVLTSVPYHVGILVKMVLGILINTLCLVVIQFLRCQCYNWSLLSLQCFKFSICAQSDIICLILTPLLCTFWCIMCPPFHQTFANTTLLPTYEKNPAEHNLTLVILTWCSSELHVQWSVVLVKNINTLSV
jgi:hypothetical protein